MARLAELPAAVALSTSARFVCDDSAVVKPRAVIVYGLGLVVVHATMPMM
jgi:hypothetical protein